MRKRLPLIISLVVGLILLAATVWAGLIVTTYHQARSNYNDRAYADAARDFEFAGRIAPDFVVGWRGDYGRGTSLLKLGETDDGVSALRVALEDVPKDPEDAPVNPGDLTDECKVRMNLAVGLERQGDALYEAQSFSGAEAKYLEASEVVAQCVPQGPEPEEQKQDTDEKAEEAQEQQSGGGEGEGGEGEGGEGEGEGQGGEGEGGEGEGEGEGEGGEGEGQGQGGEGGSPDPIGPPDGTGGKGQELWQRNQDAEELHRQKRDPGGLGDWDGENW